METERESVCVSFSSLMVVHGKLPLYLRALLSPPRSPASIHPRSSENARNPAHTVSNPVARRGSRLSLQMRRFVNLGKGRKTQGSKAGLRGVDEGRSIGWAS